MTEQSPLGPTPSTPPPSSSESSTVWIPMVGLVLALVMFGIGFGVGRVTASGDGSKTAAGEGPKNAVNDPFSPGRPQPTVPVPEPAPMKFTAKDFVLKVKLTDKQCFGTAGCTIDYEVMPTYTGSVADLKGTSFDLTFQVLGDESGPQIGTISLNDGRYDTEQRTASTSSTSTELTARVTSVTNY